ncbi:MAG: hypothetical protein RIC15_07590 [Vicingaceae bacterium]
MKMTLAIVSIFGMLIFRSVPLLSQIDAPVHLEIRLYKVGEIPSFAAYSKHYDLRPLTMPMDKEEAIHSIIWESDSTLIVKSSAQHFRIWGVEMEDGLRTMYEIMYGEDKFPVRKNEE